MKKIILIMTVIAIGLTFANAWAKVATFSSDSGGVMPQAGSLKVKTPQEAVDLNVKLPMLDVATHVQGNGVVEVGDTVVFDRDFQYFTRNQNPINSFGGSYQLAGTVSQGTTFEVTTIGSYSVSNFIYEDGADPYQPLLELGIGFRQVELRVLDGPMAGQTIYGITCSSDVLGAIAGIFNQAPVLSEVQP